MKGTATKERPWRIKELTGAESTALAARRFHGFQVEGPGLAVPILIRLGRDRTGEIVCTALAMGLDDDQPKRITAAATRIPLQEIVAAIFRSLPAVGSPAGVVLPGEVRLRNGGVAFYGELVPARVRPGAKGYTDEALRDLVRDYQEACRSDPRAPTTALARRRKLSTQAIRYALRLAEKRLHRRVRASPRRVGRVKGQRK